MSSDCTDRESGDSWNGVKRDWGTKNLVQKGWFRHSDLCTSNTSISAEDRYIREIKRAGFKIKVVEQSGVTLKRMLQRSDPFKKIKRSVTTSTVWSAALAEKGLATVPALLISWYVKFAAISISGNFQKCLHRGKEHLRALNSGKKVL